MTVLSPTAELPHGRSSNHCPKVTGSKQGQWVLVRTYRVPTASLRAGSVPDHHGKGGGSQPVMELGLAGTPSLMFSLCLSKGQGPFLLWFHFNSSDALR